MSMLKEISESALNVAQFHVMEVMQRAQLIEAKGISVSHLEVGQPSANAPQSVIQRAQTLLNNQSLIGYTNACGTQSLRSAIESHYFNNYKIDVNPNATVIVTTGSSAGFALLFAALFNPNDHVALASSSYPCYRNVLLMFSCIPVYIPVSSRFTVTAKELSEFLNCCDSAGARRPRGLVISTPSNPTGAMLSREEVEELCELCKSEKILLICDEIYNGITYADSPTECTAVSSIVGESHCSNVPNEWICVVNSFSKLFCMTGWRLGWIVVPNWLTESIVKLTQNLYISAPTLSQEAATSCWESSAQNEIQSQIEKYAMNRALVLNVLNEMGLNAELGEISPAQGGFYVYCDVFRFGICALSRATELKTTKWLMNAAELCGRVLEEVYVAITPGVDFEDPESQLGLQRIRISYSRSHQEVQRGMHHFQSWWNSNILSHSNQPIKILSTG